MVTVRVNKSRLLHEMACRGLNGAELAALAGISTATMSAVMRGRTISPRTLRKIVVALSRMAVVPGTAELLDAA